MSATKKKGVVTKEDLKRLMKQTTEQKNSSRVDSPLAKYDSLGNLYCVLCTTKVKNNLHWKAHVQGRTHKENVAALKEQASRKGQEPAAQQTRKRASEASGDDPTLQKKSKTLPSDFFDSTKPGSSKSSNSTPKLGLGGYNSSDDDTDNVTADPVPQAVSGASALPADFFDSGVKPSESAVSKAEVDDAENEESKEVTMAEKLPEGFFDNPKLDAKAREVKYVDKDEEEWLRFQKAIKEENIVSEHIQEDEDDVKQVDRNVEEIDEHIYHWSKVEELHKKKDNFMKVHSAAAATTPTNCSTSSSSAPAATATSATAAAAEGAVREAAAVNSSNSDVDDDDDDDAEFDEFLDWRSKRS